MSGLLRVPFFDDELLLSFFSRVARANGSPRLHSFCRDLGLNYRELVRGHAGETAKAAELLGYPAKELVERRVVVIRHQTVEFRGERFAGGMMAHLPHRVCLHCLADDAANPSRMPLTGRYARIHWTTRSICGCEKHGVLLQPFKCVGSPTEQADFMLQLDRKLITDFNSQPEKSCRPTRFERFVRSRLARQKDDGDLLDSLPLTDCIELCHVVGTAATAGRRFRYTGIDVEALRDIAELGYEALRKGRAGIAMLVHELRNRPEKAELCRALRNIIDLQSVGNHISQAASALGDRPRSELTVRSIAHAADVPPDLAYSYLTQHKLLEGRQAQMYDARVDLVTARVAIAALNDAIDFETARATLECSVREFRNLATSGFVPTLVGFPTETGRCFPTDRYSLSDLMALRQELIRKAVSKRRDLVTLREAVLDTGCNISDALTAITDDLLETVSHNSERPLFDGLMVDVGEVMRKLTPDAMEEEAVVGRLRLSKAAVAGLVREGIFASLPSARPTLGKWPTYAVEIATIKQFESDFVSVRRLSYDHNVTVDNVLRRVKNAGVGRAFPASVSDTPVYRRADVEGLAFQASTVQADEGEDIAARFTLSEISLDWLSPYKSPYPLPSPII